MTTSPTAIAFLSLMKFKGLGRREAFRIVYKPTEETSLSDYREDIASRAARSHRASVSEAELLDFWAKAEEQLGRSRDAGIQAFSFYDPGYPGRLRKIPDPPAVLFAKGKTGGTRAAKELTVVGTRKPTSYGGEVAHRSARAAAEAGFAIVSGLAHGCDAHAHAGCLEAGGVGVAVLAHGLDKVYPAANRDLAQRLLEEGGCLISEYPPAARPGRGAFADRDRIQSGLSDAVLVIETDVEGGTMHTVGFARRQKRPLACIRHPDRLLAENRTKGNQKLIKDGWAVPIPDGEALMRFLDGISPFASGETPAAPGGAIDEAQTSLAFQDDNP